MTKSFENHCAKGPSIVARLYNKSTCCHLMVSAVWGQCAKFNIPLLDGTCLYGGCLGVSI